MLLLLLAARRATPLAVLALWIPLLFVSLALLPAELLSGTAGLEALELIRLFPATGLLLAALPAGLLLVAPTRRLLAAGLSLLAALRSASPLALLARVDVLSGLPTGLLPARLSLELPRLAGSGLWWLRTPGLGLLPALLAGGPVLAGVTLLTAPTGLAALPRLAALLSELLLRAVLLGLLASLLGLPASLLARTTLSSHLVTPGWLGLPSAARLALLLLGGTLPALLSLPAPLILQSLTALLVGGDGSPGLLLAAELATLLALRRLLAGLARLPALLSELLGRAALLPSWRAALLAVLPALLLPWRAAPLLASRLGGVTRPLLASRCVLLPWMSRLAATPLLALLTPLSAALFASALGVAVLPAHGISGRTYTEQRINGVHRSREPGLKGPVRPAGYAS